MDNGFLIILNDGRKIKSSYKGYDLSFIDSLTIKYSYLELLTIICNKEELDRKDIKDLKVYHNNYTFNFINNNKYMKEVLETKIVDGRETLIHINNGKAKRNRKRFEIALVDKGTFAYNKFSNFISELIYSKDKDKLAFFNDMYNNNTNSFKKLIDRNIALGSTPDGIEEINNQLTNYITFRSFADRFEKREKGLKIFTSKEIPVDRKINKEEIKYIEAMNEKNSNEEVFDEYISPYDYKELTDDEIFTKEELDSMGYSKGL